MTIRCSCGGLLSHIEAICETCLKHWPYQTPRALLLNEYWDKVAAMENEMLGWKEAAEIANAENALLRNRQHEAPRTDDDLHVRGVGRDLFEPRMLSIALSQRPTDDEIIIIHNILRHHFP